VVPLGMLRAAPGEVSATAADALRRAIRTASLWVAVTAVLSRVALR